ncbi:MAG: ABC transporter ATP-binding protein [Actinobacteria bacterium]|nr:ABC transporter ATP-binding protein [Actinomycetota bacterium]
MDPKILEIIKLSKKYESGFALNIDYLYAEENKILVLIGPNGSGKSTLIRLINLLEKPDSGNIFFDGKQILESNIDKVSIRRKISAVFQEPLLFRTSVYNNILLGLSIRKQKLSDFKDSFDFLIKKLKLQKLLDRNPRSLSGGEQQRVALARALILNPKLLLLDEPLANIDQISREELRVDLFDLLKNTGRSTIYVTHDRNEAMILADDIAVINEGRIEQYGNKNEVFRKPENEFVAKFVGAETLLEGIIIESSNNVCKVRIKKNNDNLSNSSSIVFAVSDALPDTQVMIAIRPEDVTLYNTEVAKELLSAMNSFNGIITDMQDTGIFKKIEIDCGFKIISFVTPNSIERLGLFQGKKIIAGVKASSIHLFKK